ncbi:MAG: hypothetical protein IVW57_11130, partial [Ktedonobacterales bacterium]|nr:hypothetical protein [Ktedonobacterales bacterium]
MAVTEPSQARTPTQEVPGREAPAPFSVAAMPGGFPARRLRRLRRTEGLRRMVRETALDPADFIYPLFISEVVRDPMPIHAMPGQHQWPVSAVGEQARKIAALGIGGVLLFGIPAAKDALGSSAYAEDG